MDTSTIVSIVSIIIGILGTVGTVYFGMKSLRLEQRIRRFDWDDISIGIKSLNNKIFHEFRPEIVLSISGPGSIISNLLLAQTSNYAPLYVGISKKVSESFDCLPNYKHSISTSKWITYIPDELFNFKNRRVLICEDCVLSGDTMSQLVNVLVNNGFRRENILTMSLFVTEVAISSNKGPDIYWYKLPDSEFYLPWGKSLGRGY